MQGVHIYRLILCAPETVEIVHEAALTESYISALRSRPVRNKNSDYPYYSILNPLVDDNLCRVLLVIMTTIKY